MDDAVGLVHPHIFHTVLNPIAEELVQFLAAFDLRSVQGNDTGSGLDLEYTGEPVLTCGGAAIGVLGWWTLGIVAFERTVLVGEAFAQYG